jgi:ABC-type nickel/cobalt efflux system permease component RcnA
LETIFLYGVLHAFGPDHLTAIADFSIGKNRLKTFLITVTFAIGHGITLFLFAKILESVDIPEGVLEYADILSASVIFGIGIYFLYLVFTNRIHLAKHTHNGREHIHIYFSKEHSHSNSNNDITSVFVMGALMGIGGVRGMLITLSAITNAEVNYLFILYFTLGVISVFLLFGVIIAFLNSYLLNSEQNVRRVFGVAGTISIGVATYIAI